MSNQIRTLITGITGQDGSFLAESLLKDGEEVYGMIRRSSTTNTKNIDHIMNNIEIVEGDLCDSVSINNIIKKVKPHFIYNLAAQSHVHTSFEQPEYTTNVNALGVVRILEAIRNSNFNSRFYQAGTSEMFGNNIKVDSEYKIIEEKCNENSLMNPVSPYAISKLYAYHIVKMYREAYNIFACTGILFNHESERRGDNFVTKKICNGFKKIYEAHLEYENIRELKEGQPNNCMSEDIRNWINVTNNKIPLGNLDAKRDWGFAPNYVEAMKLILRNNQPVDYVVGTGEMRSVKEFIETCIKVLKLPGTIEDYVRIDPKFYRPVDVNALCADSSKIKNELGWYPKTSFEDMVRKMLGIKSIGEEFIDYQPMTKENDVFTKAFNNTEPIINYRIPKSTKEIFKSKFQETPNGYIDLYISDINVSDNIYGIDPKNVEKVEGGYLIRMKRREK